MLIAIRSHLPSAAEALEGIFRTLRYTPLHFCLRKKKTTHGIPHGLPSVALAKDGGGCFNSSE